MKNYFDLTGQVALVTGCSTGLGVQMAKALANQGAKIVAVAPASPYHAAKGGVVNLTRGLAAEWGKYNICIKKIFQNNSSSLSFMAKSFGSTNESSVQLPNKTKKRDLPLWKITL